MNNDWAFLPMRSSNDLLGDPDALRARLDEDSYLYFQGVLDPDKLLALRREMLTVLADHGWVLGGDLLMDAVVGGAAFHEDQEEFLDVYGDVQRLQAFHTFAHDDRLTDLMRQVVGPTAFPHPLKIARLAFPGQYEVSTPPHQDYPNNQGSTGLTAAWIPVGDCPRELGALAVLRGSHRYGLRPLAIHRGAGKRQAVLDPEMLEELHWVTTDFAIGDVLVFPSLTVHAALNNATEFNLRVSVDFRFQPEGAALTPITLEPHFQRLTWEEIYAGWTSDELQYYWRDLDYQVVPFETFPVEGMREDTGFQGDGKAFESALREQVIAGTVELPPEDWREVLTIEARRAARTERRHARVAEQLAARADDPQTTPGT
ncbi:MAG: phytanoyl-CoA dioxygenase family protein [Acidimicrobiales bacterium]|nr:phytanoyl-CoA dioxygenase family protein [Acidimicrobiales bacterium]HMS86930.1 phytanoyl-CoA dioxygenase family protein [Acidimicrobiales bacterium]